MAVADAHLASTDGGLMQHMGQKRGGQVLLADSVGQLRWLNRQSCVFCGTQITVVPPVQLLRKLGLGHFPGQTTTRASGRSGQRYGSRSATPSGLAASTSRRTSGRQPASELPYRDVGLTETSSCSPSFARPRRWHSHGAWSLDTPRLGQKVSKEP